MVPNDSVSSNLRKGVLEYCVLAMIGGGDMYGLDIANGLQRRGLLTSEGTLYPLLARLRRNGLVDTSWRESLQGAPRRYYTLTAAGHDSLATFASIWDTFSASVTEILTSTPGETP
ncbi:PadR family transcriptional regulator [Arthrobacter psychrolactophilus]|uniref:PadR family transcriptional regulator n=1 Tax=Arthrobacter psychrolactophilus TaxID=92442 RepID=A0A2V5IQF1_9MICC|nr:PadR family transcriptional regulator [Arthrobacter psychrolactophilus]PYI38271.1 PadR family transcriptional regulator [Arthrobacter psychrolactophilus]